MQLYDSHNNNYSYTIRHIAYADVPASSWYSWWYCDDSSCVRRVPEQGQSTAVLAQFDILSMGRGEGKRGGRSLTYFPLGLATACNTYAY